MRKRTAYTSGARVTATRTCPGFFHKGQIGTVTEQTAPDWYRVRFDQGRVTYLLFDELKPVPARRESVFARFAMVWIRFWRGDAA